MDEPRKISIDSFRKARATFSALLNRQTKESEWQRFFSEYPYVLSEALPVHIEPNDIRPLAKPGKSEPDLGFYPEPNRIPFVYGVIELKRPDTPILSKPRENIITLSNSAATALAQAKFYAKQLERQLMHHKYRMLSVGNELHVFLILGMSDEIATKVTSQILSEQFNHLLPAGFRLLPFDTLFRAFESRIPPRIHFLVPDIPIQRLKRPTVDYTRGGVVIGVTADQLDRFLGITLRQKSGHIEYLQHRVGTCIFCGDQKGYESMSPLLPESGGGSVQRFVTGEYRDYAYRVLRCTQRRTASGMPLEFRELYKKATLSDWFKKLQDGHCERCGVNNVKYEKSGYPDREYVSWTCNVCGFLLQGYYWGATSNGA